MVIEELREKSILHFDDMDFILEKSYDLVDAERALDSVRKFITMQIG